MRTLEKKTINNWQIIIKLSIQNQESVNEKPPKPRKKTDFFYPGPCLIG